VAFEDIVDPELTSPTVSQALDLAERPGQIPERQLLDWLRQPDLLFVLDNLGQPVARTGVLAELISDCRGVRMLATSREPLHLRGEQPHEVPWWRRTPPYSQTRSAPRRTVRWKAIVR
jgi:predicted ATPase